MAIAELVVNLIADTGQFIRGMNSVARKVDMTGRQLQGAGKAIMGLTAPLAGFGVAAVKAYSDFESAFAGVRKTVNATEPEFKALSQGLMDMSETMPQSAAELAKIAENAGQLGVKKEDILSFTKTMAMLGDTTNLTSEQAAISLAQFANIIDMPLSQIGNLGAAIVGLGNNSATMESNIVEMGQRIASAGDRFGLTAAEIMGLSAALASTGIEAEAGGSAISRVLKKMESASISGGEALKKYSDFLGTDLKAAMDQSASGAFTLFIQKLQEVRDRGGDMNAVLAQFGFGEIRVSDALGRLSKNTDLLRNSFALSTEEYRKGTALQDEAAKRYETLASRLDMLKNTATNAMVVIGFELLPAINEIIKSIQALVPVVQSWIQAFQALSPETKQLIVDTVKWTAAIGASLFVIGKAISAFAALYKLKVLIIPAIGLLKIAVAGLAKAGFLLLLNPVGLTITAIAALAAGIVYFRKEIGQAITAVKNIASEFVSKLVPAAQKAFEGLSNFFTDGKIVKSVEKMMDGIWQSITSGFNKITTFVSGATNKVTGYFHDMYIAVVGNSIVPDMVDEVGEEFDRMGDKMITGTDGTIKGVVSNFDQLSSSINQTFVDILGDSDHFLIELGNKLHPQGFGGLISDFMGGSEWMTEMGRDFADTIGFELEGLFDIELGEQFGTALGSAASQGMMSGIAWGADVIMKAGAGFGEALFDGKAYSESDFNQDMGGGANANAARGQMAWWTGGLSEIYFGFENLFSGGTKNVGTLARRAFEQAFNQLVDGKNIRIFDENGVLQEIDRIAMGSKDRFNKPWAEAFFELTGDAQSAFLGVGYAMQNMLGITEDIGGQIGAILADNLGGSLQNLALLLIGMEIPITDMEAAMVQAFNEGSISAHDFSVYMQGINQAYAEAEAAQNDLGLAIQLWLGTNGQGEQSVRSFQGVITAAMNQGINTIEGFIHHAIQSGLLTAAQGDQLMRAFAAHGITSMDQIANASEATFIHIMGSLQTMEKEGENSFFGLSEKMVENFDTIEKRWERIRKLPPAELEMKIKVTGDKAPIEVAPDGSKGGSFKIPAMDTGGIVTSPTLALIGEKRSEAVIPLQELPSMMKNILDSTVSTGREMAKNVFNIDARGAQRGVGDEIKRALLDFGDIKNGLLGTT